MKQHRATFTTTPANHTTKTRIIVEGQWCIASGLGRAVQGRAGLDWAVLGWAGLVWAVLCWAGLGWAGLGWARQSWAGLAGIYNFTTESLYKSSFLFCSLNIFSSSASSGSARPCKKTTLSFRSNFR